MPPLVARRDEILAQLSEPALERLRQQLDALLARTPRRTTWGTLAYSDPEAPEIEAFGPPPPPETAP